MECPACSYENNDDSQFCSQCGFPLYIDESELPDDIHLPASSWEGMERDVPYVIAGLKTGQLPSSLENRDTTQDDSGAPKKLETVFYADYVEAFGIEEENDESEGDSEASSEDEEHAERIGELDASEVDCELGFAGDAEEAAEPDFDGVLRQGEDAAESEVAASGPKYEADEESEHEQPLADSAERQEMGSDCDSNDSNDGVLDAAGNGARGNDTESEGAADEGEAESQAAAGEGEAGSDAEFQDVDGEGEAGNEAESEGAAGEDEVASVDGESADVDGEDENEDGDGDVSAAEGSGADAADGAFDVADANGADADDEDDDAGDDADADDAGDDTDAGDEEDDDIPMPMGKHARVALADGRVAAAGTIVDGHVASEAQADGGEEGEPDSEEAEGASEGDSDAEPTAVVDSAAIAKGSDASDELGDSEGYDGSEPPWPEEYQPQADALEGLPDITAEDYTRMHSPNETAEMPVITRRDAVRYSTSDRDRLDARRKRMPVIPMLIAVLLAILGIFAIVSMPIHRFGGTEVPDVVGMSSDSARNTLLEAGFQVDVQSQLTEDNFGIVLSCDPEAGTKRKQGTHVTITVSASRTVPDVVGMDLESAQNKLADEGAENVQVTSKASNQPENTVIDVEPAAGEAFNPEDEITLVVATSAEVPDVVGMQQADAEAALTEVGYVAEVKWADSDADAGTVISTTPEAGANANLNSTVTVFVASPGPRDVYHMFDYFDAIPSADSEYLQWKGFSVAGGYTYESDDGTTYASQTWQQEDGSTISFTSVPYTADVGASYEDYLAAGIPFQGIRFYIPAHSAFSLGTDVSMDGVQAYMDACGFDNLKDSCTNEDVKSESGASGKELGLPPLACAQGETNGYVWTVLVTESATYIGCGPKECYEDMDPICDGVVINEMYAS